MRYQFLTALSEVYEDDFLTATEDEIKIKLMEKDGALVMLVYSPRPENSEKLLTGIQEEVGLELCG